jgi:hypothetical protein
MSDAPDALAVASSCGKYFGFTSARSLRPMFFMARATAPIFPGWVVPTRTIRIDILWYRQLKVGYSTAPAALTDRPRPLEPAAQLFYIDGIVS